MRTIYIFTKNIKLIVLHNIAIQSGYKLNSSLISSMSLSLYKMNLIEQIEPMTAVRFDYQFCYLFNVR